MSNRLLLSVALMSVVLMGVTLGCRSSRDMAGRSDPIPDSAYPQIAVIDDLQRKVVFSEPKIVEEPGQPMTVHVDIAFKKPVLLIRRVFRRDQLHVQYKFEFYDRQKMPVEPMMDWKYVMLPQDVQVPLVATALDTSAHDWRLIVRPAR